MIKKCQEEGTQRQRNPQQGKQVKAKETSEIEPNQRKKREARETNKKETRQSKPERSGKEKGNRVSTCQRADDRNNPREKGRQSNSLHDKRELRPKKYP